MSVLPEQQRQGIGSALMREALSRVRDSGEAMVVLWGHPEFYPRFGFRRASDFGLLPDTPAAMVYPLQADLRAYAGLSLPH
ncbi:GNAT family N-acetyltransferase [Deinococcus koreensis]|nr:GNAT family N-acetyltransferase [Deinococcus koreensis]